MHNISLRPAHLVAMVMVVAACSGGTAASTTVMPTTTTTPSTTTVAPATTTSEVSGTTTAPIATTTTDASLAPGGSGCTPGSGDLGDGLWYGEVDSFDTDRIAFDLACWFSGDAATAAAAADGEESPPPNDYYVRNENDLLRDLEVGADTPVLWYPSGDPNDFLEGTFTQWTDFLVDRGFALGIWVAIEDDVVVSIEEQWVP